MAISEYLRGIRELVGTRLLLVPTVIAFVHDDAGRVLMQRLGEPAHELWTFPGGAIDPDESPDAAVVRETREETGLEVEVVRLHSVHGGPEFRVTWPNGDQGAYVLIAFECRVVGGRELPDGTETSELRWVDRDEALALPVPSWATTIVPRSFERG